MSLSDPVSIMQRRDIRKMSKTETDRFFDAVDKMMENKNGPGTSEFFRIASYHGQPQPFYCEHGRETYVVCKLYTFDIHK